MNKRVLVVGAHPDDADFSSAGTMLKWTAEGFEAYYLICTNGDKGGTNNNHSPEELIRVRRSEQEAAASLIGAKQVVFLGYNDGELTADQKLKKDIVRVIRQIRPRVVFSFDPANQDFDGFHLHHSDHRNAAIAVFDAIYPAAKNKYYFPELMDEGLAPHKIGDLYLFGTNRPDTWIDITGVIERKIQVLRCHKSQFSPERMEMLEAHIRSHGKKMAQDKDYEYAEAFRKISFVY